MLGSSVFDALDKLLTGGFNKNNHLAWYTRAVEGARGQSANSFFILIFKDLDKFDQLVALKQIKVSNFTLDVCCALSESPPPKDESLDTIVVLDGLVPCLFEDKIIFHHISKFVDFDLKDVINSRSNTGKASIIVSKVKAFLPLEFVFDSKLGHPHVVKIRVLNYKPEHQDLGSCPYPSLGSR